MVCLAYLILCLSFFSNCSRELAVSLVQVIVCPFGTILSMDCPFENVNCQHFLKFISFSILISITKVIM